METKEKIWPGHNTTRQLLAGKVINLSMCYHEDQFSIDRVKKHRYILVDGYDSFF